MSCFIDLFYISNINNDKDIDLKSKILGIYNNSKKVYFYRRIKIALFRAYGLIVKYNEDN